MQIFRLFTAIVSLLMVTTITFSQVTNKAINYESLVTVDGSTAETPVGYSFDNFGPYTAYEKIWVFYSNGSNAIWRTKQAEEGGNWSQSNILFSVTDSPQFNMAFDGEYFHFIRAVEGDLMYRRGKAQPDGSIQFDPEVTAYTHATWKLRTTNGAVPRHFAVTVDHEKHVWVALKVGDGDEVTSNFKPIAIASIATDGSWQNRTGFPVDLAVSYNSRANSRAFNVIEISPGKILFSWASYRSNTDDPQRGIRARLWSNGTLGSIEVTGMTYDAAASSVVVPQTDIALLNRGTEVARRNVDGSWDRIDPTEMINSSWNVLTARGGTIRLWDVSGTNIRYKESQNNGTTWGTLTTKWTAPESIYQINGSHAKGSQGTHHSILWATGTNPYDIYMGIEGTIPHPSAPLLVSPANGASDLPEDVTLIWRSIDIAHTYDVQVSTVSDFSTTVFNESGVTDTSITVTDLPLNITFYWRVRAVSEGGTGGDWSQVRNFTTVGIPPAPILVSPANGAPDQMTALTLSWDEAAGADTYQVQLATVSDFSTTFIDQSGITEISYDVDGLDNERTYYWRVRGKNDFGDGAWSQVWNFTTRSAIPIPPVLASPDDGMTNAPTSLTVSWQESPGADSYRLQISKVTDFSSTVLNVGSIIAESYDVTDLENSTTYYWRVNASNESGTSGWSSVRNFTTIIEIPSVPVLVAPANLADEVSTKPLLDWTVSDRAESYQVQVASDTAFDTILLEVSDIDSTSYRVVDELNAFTPYYWRVNATNIGGTSDWSSVRKFTTGQAFPVAPTLVSPENGTTEVVNALLLWNAVATATQYHLQISPSDDFSSTVVNNNAVTNTFYTATNLIKFTQYYWRVRGISGVGAGEWSSTWSFTTGDIVSVERFGDEIPTTFALGQNYPNPFNPTTTIQFGLAFGIDGSS
jgi:hypothetical protein